MGLLNIKQFKAVKTLIKMGYNRIKKVTNPIISEECIGTKFNELGEEVSIFKCKRRFGKPKISEKAIEIEVNEEQIKNESLLAWEEFFGDTLLEKNIELTPRILLEIEQLVTKGILNKEYAEIFKRNINKEGVSFMKGCYQDLAKSMGYKKYPELSFVEFWSSSAFNPKNIKISPSAFPTKSDQIKALRHELEHFRQEELVYRIFGEETYINAKISPYLEKLKVNNEYCKSLFNKTFFELTETEITKYKSDLYEKIKKSCNIFKDSRINNIEATMEEVKEAKVYLKAIENYKSPNMVLGDIELEEVGKLKTTNPKRYELAQQYAIEYNLNALEKGAKNKENEIEKMFENFIDLF